VLVAVVALTLLHGTARMGPTTPICRAGTPCGKPAARVLLTFTHGSSHVRVRTDRLGRYRVRLVPGRWTLQTTVGMRLKTVTFAVPRAASATRNFTIDTGIR
jgi:hypothetical protein